MSNFSAHRLAHCIAWGARLQKAQNSTNKAFYILSLQHSNRKAQSGITLHFGGNSIHLAVLEKDKWTTMWNEALRCNLLPSCPEWPSWLILPWFKALKWNSAVCLREVRRQSLTIRRSHCFITPWQESTIFVENPGPLGILQCTHSLNPRQKQCCTKKKHLKLCIHTFKLVECWT